MKIESLAQLKRIPVGTKLKLVHCLLGPVPAEKQPRTVLRVQTNAMVSRIEGGPKAGVETWLHFPKASGFRPTPNGFAIYEEKFVNGQSIGELLAAQYEIQGEA